MEARGPDSFVEAWCDDLARLVGCDVCPNNDGPLICNLQKFKSCRFLGGLATIKVTLSAKSGRLVSRWVLKLGD